MIHSGYSIYMKSYARIDVLISFCIYLRFNQDIIKSHDMGFPTMWYVRPAKAQTSLRINAV